MLNLSLSTCRDRSVETEDQLTSPPRQLDNVLAVLGQCRVDGVCYGDLADMLTKNARIVTRDEEFTGVVRVADDRIEEFAIGATSARNAEDPSGDYLLPGLAELGTDNIENILRQVAESSGTSTPL